MLASTDLSDNVASMAPVLNQAAAATGVTVKLTLESTLTASKQVADDAVAGKYDAVWFASNNYLELLPHGLSRLDGTTQIMNSPVVLGVRASAARRLGWLGKPVSWIQVAQAAAKGEFTFGMANPSFAISGLMGLISVATSVAGRGTALQTGEIAKASPLLAGMFHAQKFTAKSSADLADDYLRSLNGRAAPVDGLIDYESQLLALKAKTPSSDPLTLIYPSDGVLSATYPLSLLGSAPSAAKAAYARLVEYLRSKPVQQEIMDKTGRRPIIAGVPLAGSLRGHQSLQLPFPASPSTVSALLDAYDEKLVAAGDTIYVLDTSASMRGSRLAGLKAALLALTGMGNSLASQFPAYQFEAREEVTLLPFKSRPGTPVSFRISASSPGLVLARMRSYIDALAVGGHTAIYTSLHVACQLLVAWSAANPGTINSIVLLTDGENNTGQDLAEFLRYYRKLPSGRPPVYVIALAEAKLSDLSQVAMVSGGQLFNATSERASALGGIFEEIRGFQ